MKKSTPEQMLYGLLGVLTLFMLVVATGGGVWNQAGLWGGQWQHQMFQMLCHQDPARSFWLGGQPMAVCSRCFGIYAGLFGGFLAAPLFTRRFRVNWSVGTVVLGILVAVNLGDVFGNNTGFWQNTLASRFMLGLPLGSTVLIMLGGELLQSKSNQKVKTNGTTETVP